MRTLRQQRDATGLVGRLKQALGPAATAARAPAELFAINAEDMPGLYVRVAPDGTILSLSRDLAETLGVADPANLRGSPVAMYLPAVAPGTPLFQKILEKGGIRNVPVRLLAPLNGTLFTALLSAREDAGNWLTPGAWMGCLTLSSAGDNGSSLLAGVDRELLDSIRVELRSQLELQSLRFPHGGGSEVPESVRSLVRIFLVVLPRLEAILALNTPFIPQSFEARASIVELCRASGRLLESAGVSLIFDSDPASPLGVFTDENRLRTCLNLLLGAVSITKDPLEVIVRLASEDSRSLNVEVVVSRAAGWPVLSAELSSAFELARTLAAPANVTVSVNLQSPSCVKYILRMGVPAPSESDAAVESGAGAANAIDRALQRLRVLFVGLGEGQRTVCAKWIGRQSAEFLYAATPRDAQLACSGVPPDVAVFDLSVCQAVPDFLREVPVLGLGNSLTVLPEWCRAVIEKPVFEEDLLDAIGALFPRSDSVEGEAQKSAASSGVKILAVDDNPVNQRIILRMLVRLGYEVDLASNGLEALVALRKRPYDAILMDWEMPVMDGLEATAAIRELPEPVCRIPIIALTAHAMQGDREACLKGGMDDYLSKPVNVGRLSRTVGRWLPRSPRRLGREG